MVYILQELQIIPRNKRKVIEYLRKLGSWNLMACFGLLCVDMARFVAHTILVLWLNIPRVLSGLMDSDG